MILICIFLFSCSSPTTFASLEPQGPTTTPFMFLSEQRPYLPGSKPNGQLSAFIPNDRELEGWYVAYTENVDSWPVAIQRISWDPFEQRARTNSSCGRSVSIEVRAWAKTGDPTTPPGGASFGHIILNEDHPTAIAALDRRIEGEAWIAIKLGDLNQEKVCLKMIEIVDPLPAGTEYICLPNGRCSDMLIKEVMSQCLDKPDEECSRHFRLWRGE